MAEAPNFAKLVPGFDFLQGLMQNAGAALPNIGQWVAPVLDPEELEKRIGELRTVQFWLEQNARLLGATIQALEVQRMTLTTLKTMNVQMSDLRDSLQIRMPGTAAAPAKAAASAATDKPAPQRPAGLEAAADEPVVAPRSIDPMQWWGALTQQFSQLAASAIQETSANAAARVGGGSAPNPLRGASRPGPVTAAPAGAPAAPAGKAPRKRAAPRTAG